MLINPYSANEIYFNSKFLEKNGSLVKSMSPSQLCGLISGCSYTPMLLTWELLDRCNFYCPFCYIVGHSHNEQVRFENIKSKIQELIDLGLLYCTLTGGEILLHKDFKEIYSFLKLKNNYWSIWEAWFYFFSYIWLLLFLYKLYFLFHSCIFKTF